MVLTAIKQHLVLPNLLINASCALTKVDARFATSLLARIRRQGLEFKELRVPIQEVLTPGRRKLSSKDYTSLAALQVHLTSIRLQPALPCLTAGQQVGLPLLAYAQYEKQKSWLRVRLADELRPCFEQSGVTYTSAPHAQLIKLKSPLAYRLYWLLRENSAQGMRTLELARLAWMLNLPSRGFNPSLFCGRELLVAQQQLAATDLSFTMEREYARQKSRLHAVHFRFTPLNSVRSTNLLVGTDSKPSDDWFGLEEENSLIQMLLLIFGIGGIYIATAIATSGAW